MVSLTVKMMDSLFIAIKNLTSKPTILCDPILQTAAYVGARQLDFHHFENSISPKPIKTNGSKSLGGTPTFLGGLNSPKSATNPFECWLNPHESPEINRPGKSAENPAPWARRN